MAAPGEPYYRRDLALAHHRGFGFHADACAPGILKLLEPVRDRAAWSSSSDAAAGCSPGTWSTPVIA